MNTQYLSLSDWQAQQSRNHLLNSGLGVPGQGPVPLMGMGYLWVPDPTPFSLPLVFPHPTVQIDPPEFSHHLGKW